MLDQFRSDLRNRRNLDIYASIAVAAGASATSAFDLLPPEKSASAVMAVLAVLAFTMLSTRTTLEKVDRVGSFGRFTETFPADLSDKRDRCRSMLLAGVSLSRTIDHSYGSFERLLSDGATIKVLLTSPEADPAALDARCQRSRPEISEIRSEIEHSLRRLARLKRDTSGDLEVRATKAAHKFGANHLYPGTRRAELHIQMYSFRLAGESRPMFVLTPSDGTWYDCFSEQLEGLWNDADVVDLAVGVP